MNALKSREPFTLRVLTYFRYSFSVWVTVRETIFPQNSTGVC